MPYRVHNWFDDNAGLKQRGSLTLWLNKEALEQWVMSTATGRRGAAAAIPPRHDARPSQPGVPNPSHPRDQILERIEQVGHAAWKQETGYHRHSLAETTMFRLKVTFRGCLKSQVVWKAKESLKLYLWSRIITAKFSILATLWRRIIPGTTLFKQPLRGRVRSRSFDNQAVALFLQCAALNRMIQLAKPDSYPVEA